MPLDRFQPPGPNDDKPSEPELCAQCGEQFEPDWSRPIPPNICAKCEDYNRRCEED